MDVRCDKCQTEYEFDDALVTNRGTSVKCTQCGNQFKIFRLGGGDDDKWVVEVTGGAPVVYGTLRELQRAILSRQVGRSDTLVRGPLRREIGQIAELVPFFDDAKRASKPPFAAASEKQTSARPAQPDTDLAKTVENAAAASLTDDTKSADANAKTAEQPAARTDEAPIDAKAEVPKDDDTMKTGAPVVATGSVSVRPSKPPPLPQRASTISLLNPTTKERIDVPKAPRLPSIPPPLPERARSIVPPMPKRSSVGEDTIDLDPNTVEIAAGSATVKVAGSSSRHPSARPASSSSRPAARPASSSSHPAANPTSGSTLVMRSVPPAAGKPEKSEKPAPMGAEEATKVEAPSDAPPPMRARQDSASADILERPSRLPPPTIKIEDDPKSVPPPSVAPKAAAVPRMSEPPKKAKTSYAMVAVVAAVAAGGAYMFGRSRTDDSKPPVVETDSRVPGLVSQGEQALAAGDLEGAKEAFDKASAIAEKDPKVRSGLARLAVLRADESWLKLRLLPVDASDELAIVKKALATASERAQKTTEEAGTSDATNLSARTNALRIAGDVRGARALADKLGASAGTEGSYAVAALELAESEDTTAATLDRLRKVAADEGAGTRGRSLLVYALARSGAIADAKAELDKLGATPTPPVFLPTLRGFVARAKDAADGGVAPAAAADGGGGATLAGSNGTTAGGSSQATGATPPAAVGGDVRALVSQGQQARAKGEYDRAKQLFNSALEKQPNDSEALNGLAECLRGQRDLNGARAAYKRVLSVNPGYLPALVGYADVEYELGNQTAAQKAYKDIVDGFPGGAYPARVRQRANEGTGGGSGGGSGASP